VIIIPGAEHQEINGSHAAYNQRCNGDWLPHCAKESPRGEPVMSLGILTMRSSVQFVAARDDLLEGGAPLPPLFNSLARTARASIFGSGRRGVMKSLLL